MHNTGHLSQLKQGRCNTFSDFLSFLRQNALVQANWWIIILYFFKTPNNFLQKGTQTEKTEAKKKSDHLVFNISDILSTGKMENLK